MTDPYMEPIPCEIIRCDHGKGFTVYVPFEKTYLLNKRLTHCEMLLTEAYDPDKWIRTANMAVYLENVTTLLSTMGILAPADFPVDMNFLTYRGANAIEKALLQVHDRICGIQNAYQYSGAAYAGEETGL